jgi:formamidopyrimidine-DNA glycosylase
MRGELRCEWERAGAPFVPRKHDYLALRMKNGAVLAFEDKRLFGRVRFHVGPELPEWWLALAPAVTSAEFTREVMAQFLARRRRTSLKAALLMQERFPGVGNWMADEILWRSRLHPSALCGELSAEEIARLFRTIRWVSRTAVEIVSDDWTYPPSWLFLHRWEPGGHCPRCHAALERGTYGGRTTAWCRQCQPLPDRKQDAEGRRSRPRVRK